MEPCGFALGLHHKPENEVVMNEENEQLDVIKDFREFEKSSYDKWHNLYENIKEDRKFIAGDQNDKVDKKLIGDNVTECRLNVVSNAIRTIVNTYLPNQYKWQYENQQELTTKADEFLKTYTVDGNVPRNDSIVNFLLSKSSSGVTIVISPVYFLAFASTNSL